MQPAQILERIQKAELKAQKILEEAQILSQKILAPARQKASEIFSQTEEKVNLRVKSMVKKAIDDAEDLTLKYEALGEKEKQAMELKLAAKISETVQFLVKEFKKYYGAF